MASSIAVSRQAPPSTTPQATPPTGPSATNWWTQNAPTGQQDPNQVDAGGQVPIPTSPGGTAQQPIQNTNDPVAFIRQYQATHDPSTTAPADIIKALQAAGFNASPYMYGNTPSGNEISLNGEKFKVIGGENSGSPSWYRGEDDSGGPTIGNIAGSGYGNPNALPPGWQTGQVGGQYPLANVTGPGLEQPFATPFQVPTGTDDPGFQFAMDQGQQALLRNKAALGTLRTGGAIKDLEDYTTGKALQGYSDAYNRAWQRYMGAYGIYDANRQFQYNTLAGQQSQGLGAATNYANNVTDLQTGAANAKAGAQAANGTTNANTVGSIAGTVTGAISGRTPSSTSSGASNPLTVNPGAGTNLNPYSGAATGVADNPAIGR